MKKVGVYFGLFSLRFSGFYGVVNKRLHPLRLPCYAIAVVVYIVVCQVAHVIVVALIVVVDVVVLVVIFVIVVLVFIIVIVS